MNNEDLLLKTNSGIFSYRIAGVLIRYRKILIQRVLGDTVYSLPGVDMRLLEKQVKNP